MTTASTNDCENISAVFVKEWNPIKVGGCADHVYILCLLSKKVTQIKLLEEVKKQSSKWIKPVDAKYSKFYWQEGYGIFSVNPFEIDVVTEYITNQKIHHQKRTFKDEFFNVFEEISGRI